MYSSSCAGHASGLDTAAYSTGGVTAVQWLVYCHFSAPVFQA